MGSIFMPAAYGCRLKENLCRADRVAAAADEVDARVQVGFAGGETLREVQREARFDQDVQAPSLDLVALVLALDGCFGLCRLRHRFARVRYLVDDPSRGKLGVRTGQDGSSSTLRTSSSFASASIVRSSSRRRRVDASSRISRIRSSYACDAIC